MFGLKLPARAYPLMLALLGRAPPLALSERAAELFERLAHPSGAAPYVTRAFLIVVAACVLYTATLYFDVSGS